MNDFVDIFNGKKGYGSLLRSCFADPAPPCIRRVRIDAALATFTPPYPKLPRPCMTLFFCLNGSSSPSRASLPPGNYTRRKVDRLSGTRKGDGYIKSATSAHLDRLIDILLHLEKWQNSLQEKNKELGGGEHAWKKHFITRESWFDLRLCILGFVSTCRFLFDLPEIFQVDSLSPNDRRFICPRNLSQVSATFNLSRARCLREKSA